MFQIHSFPFSVTKVFALKYAKIQSTIFEWTLITLLWLLRRDLTLNKACLFSVVTMAFTNLLPKKYSNRNTTKLKAKNH